MKGRCKVCKKLKEVSPKFIGIRYIDPKPPFVKKQLVAKTLVMCSKCYKEFKSDDI